MGAGYLQSQQREAVLAATLRRNVGLHREKKIVAMA